MFHHCVTVGGGGGQNKCPPQNSIVDNISSFSCFILVLHSGGGGGGGCGEKKNSLKNALSNISCLSQVLDYSKPLKTSIFSFQVKVWFQNRRTKYKRTKSEEESLRKRGKKDIMGRHCDTPLSPLSDI